MIHITYYLQLRYKKHKQQIKSSEICKRIYDAPRNLVYFFLITELDSQLRKLSKAQSSEKLRETETEIASCCDALLAIVSACFISVNRKGRRAATCAKKHPVHLAATIQLIIKQKRTGDFGHANLSTGARGALAKSIPSNVTALASACCL